MARVKSTQGQTGYFSPHLQPGERLVHFAFGVKLPPILLILSLYCLAILPGMIIVSYLTKEYWIGLTDHGRLIVLRVSGKTLTKTHEFRLGEGTVKTSTGLIFTHITIKRPQGSFTAKFHRAAFKTNREQSIAIAQALETKPLPTAA